MKRWTLDCPACGGAGYGECPTCHGGVVCTACNGEGVIHRDPDAERERRRDDDADRRQGWDK